MINREHKAIKDMLKGKEVIIFDLDGTLIDSINMYNEIYALVVKHVSNQTVSADQIQADWDDFVHRNHGDLRDGFLTYLDQKYSQIRHDIDELRRLYSNIEYNYISEKIRYKHFAKDVIMALKKKGYRLVLATLASRKVLDIYNNTNKNLISDFKIYDVFDLVLAYDDVKKTKPDPQVYLVSMKKMNVGPDKCLAIEDSLEGVKSANNARIEVLNVVDANMFNTQSIIDDISIYKLNNLKEFFDLIESGINSRE